MRGLSQKIEIVINFFLSLVWLDPNFIRPQIWWNLRIGIDINILHSPVWTRSLKNTTKIENINSAALNHVSATPIIEKSTWCSTDRSLKYWGWEWGATIQPCHSTSGSTPTEIVVGMYEHLVVKNLSKYIWCLISHIYLGNLYGAVGDVSAKMVVLEFNMFHAEEHLLLHDKGNVPISVFKNAGWCLLLGIGYRI